MSSRGSGNVQKAQGEAAQGEAAQGEAAQGEAAQGEAAQAAQCAARAMRCFGCGLPFLTARCVAVSADSVRVPGPGSFSRPSPPTSPNVRPAGSCGANTPYQLRPGRSQEPGCGGMWAGGEWASAAAAVAQSPTVSRWLSAAWSARSTQVLQALSHNTGVTVRCAQGGRRSSAGRWTSGTGRRQTLCGACRRHATSPPPLLLMALAHHPRGLTADCVCVRVRVCVCAFACVCPGRSCSRRRPRQPGMRSSLLVSPLTQFAGTLAHD